MELRGRRRERAAERGLRWGRALSLAGRGREAVEKAGSRVGWTGEGLRTRKGVVLGRGLGVGWGLGDGGRGGAWP